MAGETLGEVIRRLSRSGGLQADLAQTDAQLLERFARRRDEPAFAALMARHGPMVLGLCRRLLSDPRDAEDAFQAAFLVLARKAGAVRRQALLGPWLYGVAWRVALPLRGQAARRRERERAGVDLDALPADDAAWSDVRWVVQEEVQRLPDVYRSAIILCCLEGKTNEEAARLLGRPVGTVKSRLTRARELLRSRLARRGMTVSVGGLGAVLAAKASMASAALVDATVRAVLPSAAGGAAVGGVVSARAVALSQGVLRTMMLKKLTFAASLVLAVAVFGGAGGLAYRAWAAAPGDGPKAPAADKPAAVDAPKDENPKEDKKILQGVWRVDSVEVAGKDATDKWLETMRDWVVDEQARVLFRVKGAGETGYSSQLKLDPDKKPKEIDFMPIVISGLSDQPNRGVYSLDGEVWKVCFPRGTMLGASPIKAQDRPKELLSTEANGAILITLKRVKPDQDKPKGDKPSKDDAPSYEFQPGQCKESLEVRVEGGRTVYVIAVGGPGLSSDVTIRLKTGEWPRDVTLRLSKFRPLDTLSVTTDHHEWAGEQGFTGKMKFAFRNAKGDFEDDPSGRTLDGVVEAAKEGLDIRLPPNLLVGSRKVEIFWMIIGGK